MSTEVQVQRGLYSREINQNKTEYIVKWTYERPDGKFSTSSACNSLELYKKIHSRRGIRRLGAVFRLPKEALENHAR